LKKHFTYLLIIFLGVEVSVKAQDIHFSQFYNAPMNLNPALSGLFDGDYRFIANQRTQWRSVTKPYKTYGISAEMKNIEKNTRLNGALSIFYDRTGDSKLSTFIFAPVVSKIFQIKDSVHYLSAGVQPVFTQFSINYEELNFDEQYNGSYFDSSIPVSETFQRNSRNYANLNIGLAYRYFKGLRNNFTVGYALFNLFKPKQSFFNNNDVRLFVRKMVYVSAVIKINNDFDALPQLSFASQHNFREFIFGGLAKYYLRSGAYKAAYLGVFYRNKDAGYITAAVDYNQWHVALSYDVNVSKLIPASRSRGGLEIGIIYIFEKFKPVIKRFKYCPDFM
jgi:type IX secretion system PorP/SprF family membrane protein